MKNKFLTLILLMFVSLSGNGQSNSWILGSNKSFNNLTPISLPIPVVPDGNPYNGYDGQVAQNAQNIVTEANGDIRFFIVDGFIYDRNGFLIDEMTSTFNNYSAVYGYMGQTAAVPIPGSCDEYLLFQRQDSMRILMCHQDQLLILVN